MRFRWEHLVPPLVASVFLAASLGLTGCRQPASEPAAGPPPGAAPGTVTPAAGTRTAVLTVNGMT